MSATGEAGGQDRILLGLNLFDSVEWMGGTIYILNLVRTLAALPPAERPRVRLLGLLKRSSELVQDLIALDLVEYDPAQLKGRHTVIPNTIYRLRRYIGRNVPLMRDPETRGLDAIYPALQASRNEFADIYWIPDFQIEYFPHLFTPEDLAQRRGRYEAIAAQDGTLVLSSEAALGDFRRFYPNRRVNPVVWRFCTTLPAERGRDPHQAYGLPEKYLYLPNQFWAHKDHRTAFAALRIAKERGCRIDLVCSGLKHDNRNSAYVSELQAYIAEAGLEQQIHFLGLVPRTDQIEIFRHAAAVLQPSLFEGWSTVVEDAKAVGRPIILSDLPVHIEQAPDEATYFKRSSTDDLARVLLELWPKLMPGPDSAREQAAAERTAARRLAAGRAFMDILRDARSTLRARRGR
jgi:glycosyltransferase involved in cell wall biosynthesis